MYYNSTKKVGTLGNPLIAKLISSEDAGPAL